MWNKTAAAAIILSTWAATTQAQTQSIPNLYDLHRFQGLSNGSTFNAILELHFTDTNADGGMVSGCFYPFRDALFPFSGTWSRCTDSRMLVSLNMPNFITETVEIVGIILPAPDDAPNFSFRGHWLNGFLGSGAFDAISIIPDPPTQPQFRCRPR